MAIKLSGSISRKIPIDSCTVKFTVLFCEINNTDTPRRFRCNWRSFMPISAKASTHRSPPPSRHRRLRL